MMTRTDPDTERLFEVVLGECEEHWRDVVLAEQSRWRAQRRGLGGLQPEAGRTRIAFPSVDGTHWRKVPLCDGGAISNAHEAATSAAYEAGEDVIPVARCRMDGSVLIMEHVVPVTGGHGAADLPMWTGMVDCGQVGHDRDGRLVAYDL